MIIDKWTVELRLSVNGEDFAGFSIHLTRDQLQTVANVVIRVLLDAATVYLWYQLQQTLYTLQ